MKHLRSASLLLLVFALLVAACSSAGDEAESDSDTGIPGSEDLDVPAVESSSTTSTTLGRLGLEQATLDFTACMRTEGIQIPDVRLDAQGRPVLDEVLESIDTTTPEFRAALAECASILTRAGALDLRSDPELQAVIVDQLQQFSECMRREGVRDFPDPDPAFTGTGSPYPLDELPFDDPGLQKATVVCQELLGQLTVDG